MRETVETSRDMASFWKALGNFRPRKITKRASRVKEERWVEHFKGLSGADKDISEGKQEQGRKVHGATKEVGEGREDLKKNNTFAEFFKSVIKMKSGKILGKNGIPLEFVKEIP